MGGEARSDRRTVTRAQPHPSRAASISSTASSPGLLAGSSDATRGRANTVGVEAPAAAVSTRQAMWQPPSKDAGGTIVTTTAAQECPGPCSDSLDACVPGGSTDGKLARCRPPRRYFHDPNVIAFAKRGPKPPGVGLHNAMIREHAAALVAAGHQIIAGGGSLPEKAVHIPNQKKWHRPDITYKTATGMELYVNVGKSYKNGSPVRREQEKLDYFDGKMTFVAYDRSRWAQKAIAQDARKVRLK